MKECSKSIPRRLSTPNFGTRYLKGDGIDIGGAPDPLTLYQDLFPLVRSIRVWDWPDGDAQIMAGVPDERYDFVFSSHCLEHLQDPKAGLANWFRILKPDGYLVITVPDEDLYEQGVWPSTFNRDHKSTFTIYKAQSWSPRSFNVLTLVEDLGPAAAVEGIQLIDSSYRYGLPRFDQTLTPIAECAIELVVRKRPAEEMARRGLRVASTQPPADIRIHFNQYRDDQASMKRNNPDNPPFKNDSPL